MSGFAIIPAAFNAIGGNISATDKDAYQGMLEAYRTSHQTPGMRYSQPIQPQNREDVVTPAKSLTRISDAMLTAAGMPGDPMKSIFGPAIKGEQALYAPSQMPVAGGWSVNLESPYSGDDWAKYHTRRSY